VLRTVPRKNNISQVRVKSLVVKIVTDINSIEICLPLRIEGTPKYSSATRLLYIKTREKAHNPLIIKLPKLAGCLCSCEESLTTLNKSTNNAPTNTKTNKTANNNNPDAWLLIIRAKHRLKITSITLLVIEDV